jgi:hypothetical protein
MPPPRLSSAVVGEATGTIVGHRKEYPSSLNEVGMRQVCRRVCIVQLLSDAADFEHVLDAFHYVQRQQRRAAGNA